MTETATDERTDATTRAAPVRPVRRVLFTIPCFRGQSTGAGGHYYSLRALAADIGVDYQILVIGDFMPPAFEGQPNVLMAECRYNSLRGPVFSRVEGLVKADIVHAYDLSSAMYAAYLSWQWKVPLVYTKPGGPPYNRLTPGFQNMIVFHQKDRDNVLSRPVPPRRLALIPNRVQMEDDERHDPYDPFAGMPDAAFRILTITRIGRVYEEKIRLAAALRDAVEARCGPAVLCVLGKIEHQDVHDRLVAELGSDRVRFVTDAAATYKASRHLPHCDIAVGAGRSFMEAMCHGRYTFFAAGGGRLPCFANEKTYPIAFEDNFSPRIRHGRDVDCDAAFEDFVRMIDAGTGDAYRAWARATFTRDHDSRTGARRVMEFYQTLQGHESLFKALEVPVRAWLIGLVKKATARR